MESAINMNYFQKAQSVYEQLEKALFRSDNYWQVGCAADTMLDYLQLAVEAGQMPASAAQQITARIVQAYNGLSHEHCNYGGCWYDDFGWWGIATAKALDPEYSKIFTADTKQAFINDIAMKCWDVMESGKNVRNENGDLLYRGARNAWTTAEALGITSHFPQCAPRFLGGLWQYDMWATQRSPQESCNCQNPNNPTQNSLGCFQLALIQTLYMVLTLRLAHFSNVDPDPADLVFDFLSNWIGNPGVSPENRLILNKFNSHVSSNIGLIRERIGTYAKLKNQFPKVFFFNENRCWNGDQGLFIGAMVDYLKLHPGHTQAIDMLTQVMNAIPAHMVDEQKLPKVWYTDSEQLGDPGDYNSGPGIMLRYLLYAFNANNVARELIEGAPYQEFLGNAADSLSSGGGVNNPAYSDGSLFAMFNQMSVYLTAAVAVPM